MPNTIERCKALLGTYVETTLTGQVSDQVLIDVSNEVFSEITRIQQMMSFHHPLSELSVLNKAMLHYPNQPHRLSNELTQVIQLAMDLHAQTKGYFDVAIAAKLITDGLLPNHFDISVNHSSSTELGCGDDITLIDNTLINSKPICIDLGGIAKGYAVDCAIKKIPKHIKFIINAGGDMACSDWQNKPVALRYAKSAKALKEVTMLASSVATSGNYYHLASHLVNPKKHNRLGQVCTHQFKGCVSAFADNTMLADALTKVVTLMKPKQVASVLQNFQAKAIIINRFGYQRLINN